MTGLRVRAEIRMLAPDKGGRTSPALAGYRPNHNFFPALDGPMSVGQVDVIDGAELVPSRATEAIILFSWIDTPDGEITVGREWRIQEGARVVGVGQPLEILDVKGD